MIVKDISFAHAEENILYDEKLLDLAEQGLSSEILRFWEASGFFIVLGRISKQEAEVKTEAAAADGIKIIKRRSGGGTVLQGPGCLNYSLILSLEKRPALMDIKKSYELILGKITSSFTGIGIKAEFMPLSDITLSGRKFSGNAQWRRKKYMLHHGTILYRFPIERIEKYIKMPPAEPPYRKGRSHSEFLTNINISAAEIKKSFGKAFTGEAVRI
ncbi:MAG: lipoate--protein ligase family protein [Candidatus Omnitrophica bacterium]|nr:lipoate--protein ligase family protein [Candidatus Omnitrophota bacterium]